MAVSDITKKYTIEIDGQEAQRGMTSLKAEFRDLQAYIETVPANSAEATAALKRMAEVKDEIGDLKGVIDTLNPDGKIQAFLDLGSAAAGSFQVMQIAAENFGLSSGSVEKYQQRVMELIGVLQGLEQIRNVLEPQNLRAIRSLFTLGESYTIAGVKAKLAGLTMRQAMIATGIGALIVALGFVIANFDKVKAVGAEIYEKFKPQFDAIGEIIDTLAAKARDLISAVTFGLVDDSKTAAKKVADELEVEETKRRIASRARRITELEAQGKDTFALRRKNLEEELSIMKRGTAEEIAAFNDKATELRALRFGEQKRVSDERAKEAEEAAKAAKEAAEKLKQAQEKQFNDFLQRSKDTTALLGRTVREQMAIEAEIQKLMLEKNTEELKRLFPNAMKEIVTATQQEVQRIPQPSLKDSFIARVLGIHPEAYMAMKEEMDIALGELAQSAYALTDSFLQDAIGRTDSQIAYFSDRITMMQDRIREIDQQLQDKTSNLQTLDEQITNSQGARRDYLLSKIEAERKAEASLRKERAAAAKEEAKAAADKEKAEKRRQELEIAGQRITAATSAVEAVLLAIQAARTIAKAAEKGKIGWDNIALAIGATAALVAGFAAVKNAVKLEDGGEIQGGSHASGNDVPVFGGRVRVEGGEYVTNKYSTARNRAAIERINREGRNTHFTAVPTSTIRRMADGGPLSVVEGSGSTPAMDTTEMTGLLREIANYTRVEAMKPARPYNSKDAQEIKAIQDSDARDESLARL